MTHKQFMEELDAVFQQEIKRVSQLEYNANEICRTFYENLRAKLERALLEDGPSASEEASRQVKEELKPAVEIMQRQDSAFREHLRLSSETVANWPSWKKRERDSNAEQRPDLSEYKPGQWWLKKLEAIWTGDFPPDAKRAAATALSFAAKVFAERERDKATMPVINARFYIEAGNHIAGYKEAKIRNLRREDDDSVTVTIEEDPEDKERRERNYQHAIYYRFLRAKPQTSDYPWVVQMKQDGIPTMVPCYGPDLDERIKKALGDINSATEKVKS